MRLAGISHLRRWLAAATLIFLIQNISAAAVPAAPRKLLAQDKCPVCGMFVAKYPDFACQILFKDGSRAVFDGAKDMFSYYLDMARYAQGHKSDQILAVYVTDYYSLRYVDGRTAWYAVGSDVYGPMGNELVPFGKESDAREFMKDHKGKRLLRFSEVNLALIKSLN